VQELRRVVQKLCPEHSENRTFVIIFSKGER